MSECVVREATRLNVDLIAMASVSGPARAVLLGSTSRQVIRQAPVQFQLVKTLGHGYFQTLRDKLRWAAPPGYRGE